jgi:deazaflavin-dependent oxidoreductase (nitroreductase family)
VADDYCYLTTTGRRSGKPHRIEIWYALQGDTLYVMAGGRERADWVQNLLADPEVTVEIDGVTRAARARPVEGEHDEETARTLIFDKYASRYRDDLTSWRGQALPIALALGPPIGGP